MLWQKNVNFTNLGEDHGGNLLWGELLGLAEVLDLHEGVATLVDDLEWPGLDVLLDGLIVEAATNQTPVTLPSASMPHVSDMRLHSLDIEDGVFGVHGSLVLCGLTDQSLLRSEGDERWRGEATLLVGNCNHLAHDSTAFLHPIVRTDFDAAALVDGNTGVGGTYISGQPH